MFIAKLAQINPNHAFFGGKHDAPHQDSESPSQLSCLAWPRSVAQCWGHQLCHQAYPECRHPAGASCTGSSSASCRGSSAVAAKGPECETPNTERPNTLVAWKIGVGGARSLHPVSVFIIITYNGFSCKCMCKVYRYDYCQHI